MIPPKGIFINSNLPGGWETAPPCGVRLVINRQQQGWKGAKLGARPGDRVEQVAKVNDE